LAERLSLVGERQFAALGRHGTGDAPGDRPVIGDAHDQAALAGHQPADLSHTLLAVVGKSGFQASYTNAKGDQKKPPLVPWARPWSVRRRGLHAAACLRNTG